MWEKWGQHEREIISAIAIIIKKGLMIMEQSNEIVYQNLVNQIQPLLNEKFIQELKLGKYSSWAIDLMPAMIIPMLSAIGEYGKLSPPCPNINMRSLMDDRKSLDDQLLGVKLWINEEQKKALSFLVQLFLVQICRERYEDKFTIPFEYSKESPDFTENVNWAMGLTSSDLFGIIWHVGGFASRSVAEPIRDSINDYSYSEKWQEPLICLMRVAQGQLTYYQLAGKQFPLRECQQVLVDN